MLYFFTTFVVLAGISVICGLFKQSALREVLIDIGLDIIAAALVSLICPP